MTHDELQQRVNDLYTNVNEEDSTRAEESKAHYALRAVVELASTETINRAASGERFYDGFHFALKCVLEAIEKELQ